MKLSEILKDWPEKKKTNERCGPYGLSNPEGSGFNTALDICDREIDREALADSITDLHLGLTMEQKWKIAKKIISTMPTWLKPTERK